MPKGENHGDKNHPGFQPTDRTKDAGKIAPVVANLISALPGSDSASTDDSDKKYALDTVAKAYAAFDARYAGKKVPRRTQIVLTQECIQCHLKGAVMVDSDQFDARENGAAIQDAYPNLTPGEREQLLTGIHGECYDEMFAQFDDEDDYEGYAGDEEVGVPNTALSPMVKVTAMYGMTPMKGLTMTREELAEYQGNRLFVLESVEDYTPDIRYETVEGCRRCLTDEAVPHFNCQYKGNATGHSAAHCTASACY